jgi:hypothetical protein
VQSKGERVWYVARGGGTHGPFTDDGFAQLASSGRLGLTDYVWYSGLSNWVSCEQLCTQNAHANIPRRGASVPSSPALARHGPQRHNLRLIERDARSLGAVVPAALSPRQQDAPVRHRAARELQPIAAESAPPAGLQTARPAAATKTQSARAATAILLAVRIRAFGGLSDLLTKSAAFVRGRMDQRLFGLRSSFYVRVLVLLPLVSVVIWGLSFYSRAFWPESGTLAQVRPDAIADPTKATDHTAVARAGAGIGKSAASEEAGKSSAPAKSKALANKNPTPKQTTPKRPDAKAVTHQDTASEWFRQVFRN